VYDIGFGVLRDILEMLRCDLNNRSKTAMRAQRTIEILEALVGFDTTSRNSNLPLVEWVEAYLDRFGVPRAAWCAGNHSLGAHGRGPYRRAVMV
jgi:acetylornithine deacetylase/succinyl-diaminopimelate desuccinylase-like protein